MGAAGSSGGKGGHSGYDGFSSMNSQPKKTSNLSDTGYNSEEAHEILDGSLEKRIVAYARIKHGKGEEVAAELSNENYRENYKDPFEVLDRVCNPSEVKSIDNVVDQDYQPSAFKVALKGTAHLINKTRWYYPLVGMLPGKYQEKIAEKLGDNPLHYTVSNCVLEGIVVGVATIILTQYMGGGIVQSIGFGSLAVFGCGFYNISIRRGAIDNYDRPVGSLLAGLLYYAALYSIAAVKAIAKSVKDSYSSASQQLKEQEAQKRIELEAQPSRILVEGTPDSEIDLERKSEIESILLTTKPVQELEKKVHHINSPKSI